MNEMHKAVIDRLKKIDKKMAKWKKQIEILEGKIKKADIEADELMDAPI